MGKIPFLKMHGLGNDFVVLDGRRAVITVDAAAARALADRRTGIGCDQVILLEPPRAASPICWPAKQARPRYGSRPLPGCSTPKHCRTGASRLIWDRRAPAGAISR